MSQVKFSTLLTAAFAFICTHPALAEDNVSERIAFIEERLAQRDTHANVWNDGWLVAFTGITAGQVIAYEISPTRDMQNEYRVGAVTASLGIFSQLISPNPRGNSHLLKPYATATTAERLVKLAAAERLLFRTAEGERESQVWWNNVVNLTVSTTSALILGLYYEQPGKAATRWVGGLAVTQLRYWTQPTEAGKARKEYYQRFGLTPTVAHKVPVEWHIVAGPQLTGVSVDF